jgi:nicotinamidase-related amidase
VILSGLTGDTCVLLTAADAYVRAFELFVPRDCVASADRAANRRALLYMRRVLGVNLTQSVRLDLRRLRSAAGAPR